LWTIIRRALIYANESGKHAATRKFKTNPPFGGGKTNKMRKLMFSVAAVVAFTAMVAAAAGLFQNPNNWRILDRVTLPNGNVNFATRHPDAIPGGGVSFPLLDESEGYTSYLLGNYNRDLTGKTITAVVDVDATDGTIFVSSDGCTATVGLEFQATSAGTYDYNDYWWSTDRRSLADLLAGGTLVASLADRSQWINQSGKSATDTTEDWVQWQGDVVHMSPYDGFTKAMKKVKEVSLSFGGCGYARGVAVETGTASFDLLSFSITP
jgi:hypothetical protein